MHSDHVEETIELAGRELALLRPASADELIDESAFDDDEFLPYWAEMWSSGVALAGADGSLQLAGMRVVELGAGLGLPSLAAALRGADVLATDWAEDAVALLRLNADRNRVPLHAERVRWDEPAVLLRGAPWDLVLGADLLYEARNAEQLLALLPQLGVDVLLADPGRPFAKGFLERASASWDVQTTEADGAWHRLRLRGAGARGSPRRRCAARAATAAHRLEADSLWSGAPRGDDVIRQATLRDRIERAASARDRGARDRNAELLVGVQHVRGGCPGRRAASTARDVRAFRDRP